MDEAKTPEEADAEDEVEAQRIIVLIRRAFSDVVKGDGIGPREARAIDDCWSEEDRERARQDDDGEAWWDIPAEYLDECLSFTNLEGFRFLLPAVMTRGLEGALRLPESLSFHLGLASWAPDGSRSTGPHTGDPEYLAFLRSLQPPATAAVLQLSEDQLHALAAFFLMTEEPSPHDRPDLVEACHHRCVAEARPGDYRLSLEDAHAIAGEERRILRDWIRLGGLGPQLEQILAEAAGGG